MGTTILRFAKIKSEANIRQAGAHQHRHHAETPNADPKKQNMNRYFFGSSNLLADVKKGLEVLDKEPRKNSVLAVEGLISLSPELFKGEDRLDNLNNWFRQSKKWLKEEFGDNLVNAVLHRDEQTPHIHFTFVPLIKREDGKYSLSARDLLTKSSLRDWQKSYYEAMEGNINRLEPPKYGSKRKHTEISHFYHVLDEIKENMKQDAQKMLQELSEECSATLKGRYLPLVDKSIQRAEQELEGRLTDEVKAKIRQEYERELENKIEDAFKSTPTMQGLAEKIENSINAAKLEVGGDEMTKDQTISFKRPKM